MIFIEKNLNPTGKKAADCVIRAIMCATGKTWGQVFLDLCEIGLRNKTMPAEKSTYQKYLEQIGWKKQRMPRHKDNTRYTLEQFANENKKGSFIISLANHLTVIVDGNLIDTWDCSYKCLNNYWSK